MFEKVSQIAEQAATNVSRRRFFGRFGRGAMAVAAGVAGLLANSHDASARDGGPGKPRGPNPPSDPKRCWLGVYACFLGPNEVEERYSTKKCDKDYFHDCILVSCEKVC